MAIALPHWPRLMGALLSSAYVGLGRTAFLEGVRRGDWPGPVKYGRRRLWDRKQLDRTVDSMSGAVSETAAAQNGNPNPWDEDDETQA